MASLVMTALQWMEKRGRKALGCLSLGSHKRARGLENSSLVGIDFFSSSLLFQQMYIVCKDTHTPMIWEHFGGYDERTRPQFVPYGRDSPTLQAANELRAELKIRNTDHILTCNVLLLVPLSPGSSKVHFRTPVAGS